MGLKKLHDWLGSQVNEMVDLQAELTRRPALGPVNGGEGEWEKACCLERYLKRHGLDMIEHYDAPDGRVPAGRRPNLSVTVPGRMDRPVVWVMTHLDVVPPGERDEDGAWKGWDSDPYELRRDGERIYGRGVLDNQHSMVASVFAARALVEHDVTPACTLKLLLVADEETGSDYGLKYVLKEQRGLFAGDDVIIVPDGGDESGTLIEVAEKSMLWLQFKVRGRQAHGSTPGRGVNAFRAAARLVCRLDAGLRERFGDGDDLFVPPRSTFEPTLHAANVPNINTIPGEDMFCFDCRVLPGYDLEDVLAYAREECRRVDGEVGTQTELLVANRCDAAPPTPADAPAVLMLKEAIRDVYGVEGVPKGVGGGTVAAMFRAEGFPAAVWSTYNGSAHGVNEYCNLPRMLGDARVFTHVCTRD